MNKPAETAAEAYARKMAEIVTYTKEINDWLTDRVTPDEVHWGHVGDASHVADQLKHIADFALQRGEYAPENRG